MTWHYCIGDQKRAYERDINNFTDEEIRWQLERKEFQDERAWTGTDWRIWRRLIRQEAHRRGVAF